MKAEIFRETKEGCLIRILVHPNAKRSGIAAVSPEALEVNLKSPPVKNKANYELIELLSSVLDVSKSEIKIVSGQQSREKFLSVSRQKSYLDPKLTPFQK